LVTVVVNIVTTNPVGYLVVKIVGTTHKVTVTVKFLTTDTVAYSSC